MWGSLLKSLATPLGRPYEVCASTAVRDASPRTTVVRRGNSRNSSSQVFWEWRRLIQRLYIIDNCLSIFVFLQDWNIEWCIYIYTIYIDTIYYCLRLVDMITSNWRIFELSCSGGRFPVISHKCALTICAMVDQLLLGTHWMTSDPYPPWTTQIGVTEEKFTIIYIYVYIYII